MRHPHVKICGLKSREMIDTVLSCGGKEVGFVHFAPSPRHLAIDDMAMLAAYVGGRAQVTIVTVDADDATLSAIAAKVRPDTLQLHGHESVERTAEVAAMTGLPVMKALAIGSAEDLQEVAKYQTVADRLLLDARPPKNALLPGGNGVAFDWSILTGLDPKIDYMLSGGINANNIARALQTISPYGLDVSSGVESEPGVKDAGLINGFFSAFEEAMHSMEQKRAS
ncbi:phosphoribosylanthranilate isomerase [Aureimonas fodinaquatilis]|uniref:N-(5'-phosphoribosyl)anthranilate isomerase n=1 Tax=Aureimonas fodinaquatilis TaxID=2565783 RepID=A0A5B0DPW8_9HYPH|nr:phosphoribosylanthranilate isomerase [Aureimonas fodinaquatilis]KAA0968498.1 phosphoribosylanthranilate isomerase [Aureimonas fodinaquatilis]